MQLYFILKDTTPEGKSIVELGKKLGVSINEEEYKKLNL